MLIRYYSDSPLPSSMANTVNVVKMCEAFAQLGNDVELVVPVFRSKMTTEEILKYYRVAKPFKITQHFVPSIPGALFLFAVRSIFSRKRPHQCFHFGRSTFALAILAQLGAYVGIDIHGTIWKKGWLRKVCLSRIVHSKNAKVVSFNTSQLARLFERDFSRNGLGWPPIIALPNGADVALVSETYQLKDTKSKGLRIGYLGSFLPGRGIELIGRIAEQMPDHQFHLAGGSEKDVASFRRNCSLSNVFCYGHIAHSETYGFRNACDVLLAPYQLDTRVPSGEVTVSYMSPIKIFEYMSSGKAIVCSDLAVLRDILNETNAMLVPADQLNKWVEI
jgi:glycosyltransferase involved in cell wall biosynthesis